MKIRVTQVYFEVGISYPFSHIAQRQMRESLCALTTTSDFFDRKYPQFLLTFYMSTRAELATTEIRGPSVYKKAKDVEYTIYLPYIQHDRGNPQSLREPLRLFLDAVITVLKGLQIDTSTLSEASDDLIERILSDPEAICDYLDCAPPSLTVNQM